MFSKTKTTKSTGNCSDKLQKLKEILSAADTVIIGAGAGLSTSAGFVYSGTRFEKYFSDFAAKYRFGDMYSGGFYPYASQEEFWAYWSRYIWVNRYMNPPKPVYDELYRIVKEKDYFVITTNVDHCFQKAGFARERLFYTQGDYGLLQCSEPCHQKTYENRQMIRKMLLSQGWEIAESGELVKAKDAALKMTVPSELLPVCPVCGKAMTMNLRSDDCFVEDAGWHQAAERYEEFLNSHDGRPLVFLELGVGYNTPVIIKYPFWRMTERNPNAVYVCINHSNVACPDTIRQRSLCIADDTASVFSQL